MSWHYGLLWPLVSWLLFLVLLIIRWDELWEIVGCCGVRCLWLYVKSPHLCTIGFPQSLPDLNPVSVLHNYLCGCKRDHAPFVADISNSDEIISEQ